MTHVLNGIDIAAAFPSLTGRPNGQRLAFLDTAASALKCTAVLEAMQGVMAGPYANIHRGLYHNSATTTAAYEAARETIGAFFGLDYVGCQSLFFTRNTTESLNLVAQSFARPRLQRGDVIVLSALEHHANIVPWQMVAEATGAEIRVIPLSADKQSLDLSTLEVLLQGAKVLAVTQYSNVLGVQPPLEELCAAAKKAGAAVVVDGTQAAVHGPIDLAALAAMGVDFWACTGHKLYGPTGVGLLWGRSELLANMPPYQGGGDMIERVRLPYGTTFTAPPARFEAGTPAIAEAIGLAAACEWMTRIGWDAIQSHEQAMAKALRVVLESLPFVEYYSPAASLVQAFNVRGAHPSDIATLLDQHGIAVRSGHHCAMPLMEVLGLPQGCVRASVGIYTTLADIEQLATGLQKAKALLG